MSILTFFDLFRGPCMPFIDTEAAKHALIKGYDKHRPLNNLIVAFWCSQAVSMMARWFVRLPSRAKLLDTVSRGGFSVARQQSWQHIEVDCDHAYEDLLRIAPYGVARLATSMDLYQAMAVSSSSASADGTRSQAGCSALVS